MASLSSCTGFEELNGLQSCPSLDLSQIPTAPSVEDIGATVTAWAARQDSNEHILVLKHATRDHVAAIDRAGDQIGIPWRITYFGESESEAGLLFIKMAGAEAEVIKAMIAERFPLQWHHKMGPLWELRDAASMRSEPPGSLDGRCKEADISYVPIPRRKLGQFPTLVVEVGSSQSLPPLHCCKDWWFANSPTDGVNVVLLVHLFHSTRELHLERWDRGQTQPSSLVKVAPVPDSSWTWTATGSMTIPFEPVVLREKETDQSDFVLTEEFLVWLAFLMF